jgi:hypothetical protein
MCVNLRLSSIRTGPRPVLSDVAPTFDETLWTIGRSRKPGGSIVLRAMAGRRRKGHFKVAHYEVVGCVFSKSDPSRKGRSIGCLRSRGHMPRTEGSFVPQGQLKVAHYEVVGCVFSKSDPSRKGRSIGCLRSRGRMRATTEGSFVPPGRSYL